MHVVIATSPNREAWLKDCVESLGRDCLIVSDSTFELGKIRWLRDHTDIDRFLFLQDSVIVKHEGFWQLLAQYDGSVSINQDPDKYGSYLGVYERRVLESVDIPFPQTKLEAIKYEVSWTRQYVKAAGDVPVLFPELWDCDNFVEKNGRTNMLIENDYLAKYKGTWSWEQAQ
jgi:hypothetical protein